MSNWIVRWLRPSNSATRKVVRRVTHFLPLTLERLEDRTVPSVSILNNSGNGYAGLSPLSQANASGYYYVPPDTNGAAGPSAYLETVNQTVTLYGNKATGASATTAALSTFWTTTGGLARADSRSGWSDPVAGYNDQIGRFVVADQDVDFTTHVSRFDIAVSKTSSPGSLGTPDWTFYQVNTTQTNEDADYPGNFGYNHDGLVFTLNMFAVGGTTGTNHVQVISVSNSDLSSNVAQGSLHVYQNNLNDFSVRPTTMHDSVAGDPMWLVTEHGDGRSIDVIKMQSVLSNSATFGYTNLAVTAYSQAVSPLNPDGTAITTNIDSRIDKSAEDNNTIVAAHTVAKSSTQDVVQWYAINVSSTPTLAQQGRIDAGNNTYLTYPGIDINSSSAIGMSFIRSGTDTTTDYESMWLTGRVSTDGSGTMETPVEVPNATGLANYTDFASPHRAGDLSGINVDPVDGSFWAANEFANTQATANWGTGIANFIPSSPANAADLAVINSGPSSVTAGTNATYTITITNNGPYAATGFVLTDTLPTGSNYVSITQTAGSDDFTPAQSGSTITESATAIASGSSDTFSLVVFAPTGLTAGSAFSDTASVSSDSSTSDPNTANNTATVTGSIVGAPADLAVTNVSGVTIANEGDKIVYTVEVTNNGLNPGTGVVLTDTLGTNLNYVSATASQGTFTGSGSVVTFNIGTIAVGATATLTVTAQATEEGTLTNAASVTSADNTTSNNSAIASTTVNEPAIVVSAPISTTSRKLSSVAVATFTHASGIEPTSAFTATINWGDNTTSTGSITLSGTTYTVTGSHKYSSGGKHTITTTVTEVGQATQLLLLKVGDEVPDLPARVDLHGHKDSSLNGQTNDFAYDVASYLANSANQSGGGAGSNGNAPVTLQSLKNSLVALYELGKPEGSLPPIAILRSSLRARSTSNSNWLDVLLLIDDIAADYGN